MKLYIGNLSYSTTEQEIVDLLSQYGTADSVQLIKDRHTGQSKGFGFVDMPAPAARRAIDALHGSTLQCRDLPVRFAQPRRYGG